MKNSAKAICVLFGLLALSGAASANVSVTRATGGGAIASNTSSGCSAAGTWTALTGPIVQEGNAGDIGTGNIVLTVPAGFEFNTAAAVTVLLTGSNTAANNINDLPTGSLIAPAITATTITFNVSLVSTSKNTLTWQGIQVRPTAPTPLASGNITETGPSTIKNITSSTNFGTLTEVTSTPACISPPTVTTKAATSLTATGATLNGTVSSNGASTSVTFDYGLTTAYGSSATASQSPLSAGSSGSAVSAVLTGLSCNTLYHFRVNGTNSGGTASGGDLTFTTPTCPFACGQPSNTPIDPNTNQPLVLTCQCDTFARTTLNPSTIFNSNWTVSTSDTTGILPSIVNSGYLRLTNNTGNNAKAATVPGIFPAAGNYISVEFQQYAYNGSGADGIAVTLSDYSVPAVPGAFGGSLGYAQKTGTACPTSATAPCYGFSGGWIGVALDEFGNYQNPTEGRIGGPGAVPQSVGIRGSGSLLSGYNYLAGTGGLTPQIDNAGSTTPSRGYYYQVIVDARTVASTSVAVNRDTTGTGASYASLISIPNVFTAANAQGFTQAAVPTNWQISFTGSTGGSTNIHEIGGLRICASTMVPPSGGAAGSFNAIDEAYGTPPLPVQDYLNGHIYTKLVGTPFKLNVAALTNSQIVTTFAKTVTIKLVDNSDSLADSTKDDCTLSCTAACISKPAVAGGTQTLPFVLSNKGQQQTAAFTINSAYQKLVAIMIDNNSPTPTSACSTDSFSVRPLSIASVASIDTPPGTGNAATNSGSTGSPIFKAGSGNFALTATTTGVPGSPGGYTGVMKTNFTGIASTTTYAGTLTGTFPAATSATSQSTATGTTFTYSEVGGFTLPGYPTTDTTSRRAVYDGVDTADECTSKGLNAIQCDLLRAATWTGVDSISTKSDCVADSYSNTKDANGKYGCNFGLVNTTAVIGRFVPDHFAVSANLIANRIDFAITGSITAGTGTLTLASAAGVKVGDVIIIAGAGVNGAAFTAPVASVSADGLTVTLAANATTTVTNGLVNVVVGFTYMGEPMNALFTLTAQAADNTTTKNYVDSWAKLDPRIAGALNLGAIDNPVAPGVRVPLTARINTTGLPAATGQFLSTCTPTPACLGTANVIAPFTIIRGASGDGPYRALDIGVAPVDSDSVTTIYDLDTANVTAGANNHTKVGTTEVRYGRIKVSNAYGSELLPLTLTATAQYYTPTGWINSTTDNLTNLTLAATYDVLDKNGSKVGTTTATRSPATGLLAGNLNIRLSPPTGGVTGVATVLPTVAGCASPATCYLPVTQGTATFGVYKGRDSYIYRRESY